MAWHQLELLCSQDKLDHLSDYLMELGAVSITIESPQDEILFEEKLHSRPSWESNKLIALFSEETVMNPVILAINQQFTGIPVMYSTLEDQDWQSKWQQDYQPIKVNDRLWICPSWHTPSDSTAINIFLDPGLAFGTGTHPTTLMCLLWLEKTIQGGESFIDFGCGSGILAITAKKLGCDKVYALDIDEAALKVTHENAVNNQLKEEDIQTLLAPKQSPPACDLLIANILANPLIELAEHIASCVKPAGQIALSGLLDTQAEAVIQAYLPWFSLTERTETEHWVRLCMAKK